MSPEPGFRPVGERGLLVELADNRTAQQLARHVRAHFSGRVQEVVPGHTTVLVVGIDQRITATELAGFVPDTDPPAETADPLTIAVTYDGPDLHDVAAACAVSPEEVVSRHTQARYTVAFIGFAPGFAYLIGGDQKLAPGRRDEPRERVPAGAVAIAGEYSAVYPRASPGGWQLIGHTDAVMFDSEREPPALAGPGAAVRFTEVRRA
ncbi:MAG: allophanate hydrolase subunit 1 [Actinomycetota bacterium]|nr:allophanate hydrolase subunit 1 [Actinomycetota bacterium]